MIAAPLCFVNRNSKILRWTLGVYVLTNLKDSLAVNPHRSERSGISRISFWGTAFRGFCGYSPENFLGQFVSRSILNHPLKLINQTCYILTLKGKFKFVAGNTYTQPSFHLPFIVNGIQMHLSIKASII